MSLLEPYQIVEMVRLCPYCHTSCTGEIHFRLDSPTSSRQGWFRTDSSSIEAPLGTLVDEAFNKDRYAELPDFVAAWNEGRGWADFVSSEGVVTITELLATADAVLADEHTQTADVEVWKALREFLLRGLNYGLEEAWAVED